MDANSIHASQAFKDDCHAKEEQINFNGICEHHQNGIAQHSIQILVGRARKKLLHSANHLTCSRPSVVAFCIMPFIYGTSFYACMWDFPTFVSKGLSCKVGRRFLNGLLSSRWSTSWDILYNIPLLSALYSICKPAL